MSKQQSDTFVKADEKLNSQDIFETGVLLTEKKVLKCSSCQQGL